jgi:hypothetical protein
LFSWRPKPRIKKEASVEDDDDEFFETEKKIVAVIDKIGPLSSKTIKEHLDESISYGEIKAVMEIYRIRNNSKE